MAAELPVAQEVLSDVLKNNFYGEEDDNFICLAATASTFRQENLQSASAVFSLDVAQKHAGSANHASKRKHKYRPENFKNSFSSAGLQLCSNTSANTTDEQRHIVSINVLEICRHLSDL